MIGSDEFNLRSSQRADTSTGDIDEMEYIETFLATSSGTENDSGLLIDIVCPQPRSQRRALFSQSKQSSGRAIRANSTEGRRK